MLNSQCLTYQWPIYIDRNHRGFGTFCTKSLGVSGSQNEGVLGFQLFDWLILQKNVGKSQINFCLSSINEPTYQSSSLAGSIFRIFTDLVLGHFFKNSTSRQG